MGADSIHLIINPFAFSIQFSLYSKGGELIGDNAKGPTRGIRRGSVLSKCKHLWGCPIFVALTEGAESTY
jgi:hypothetical protein